MRVLIISNLFPPHVIGGYELGCLHLARAAQAAGHDVRVLTSLATGRLKKRDDAPDLDVRSVFSPIYNYETVLSGVGYRSDLSVFAGIHPGNVLALQSQVESYQPDAIWIFNPLGLGPVGILETAVASGIPTTLHLMDHLDTTIADHQVDFHVLPRWIRAKAQIGAIACSTKTLQKNELYGGFAKTVVIPNGLSMPDGCRPARQLSTSSVNNLVYFGQIEQHKGIPQLVKALSLVQRKVADRRIKLHLIGAGSAEYQMQLEQQLSKLGLENCVVRHGFCDQQTLGNLLAEMQLAVFPLSPEEPFAYVVIEAIQAGLPIVVTAAAGCAEFLPGDYPFYLQDRDDPAHLAQVIGDAICQQDLAASWCTQLQQAVLEQCDLDRKCLPRCIDFLESLKPRDEAEPPMTIPISSARGFQRAIQDGLSSWYSSRHLANLFPTKPEVPVPKQSVGRSIERWFRKRIPTQFRQAMKSGVQRIIGRKAG